MCVCVVHSAPILLPFSLPLATVFVLPQRYKEYRGTEKRKTSPKVKRRESDVERDSKLGESRKVISDFGFTAHVSLSAASIQRQNQRFEVDTK